MVAGGGSSGLVMVAGGGSSGLVMVAGGGSSGLVMVAGGGSSGLVMVAGGGSDVVTVIVAVRSGAGRTVVIAGRWEVGAIVRVCLSFWPASGRSTASRSAGTVVTEWMTGVGFTSNWSVVRTMPSVRNARRNAVARTAPANAIAPGHV